MKKTPWFLASFGYVVFVFLLNAQEINFQATNPDGLFWDKFEVFTNVSSGVDSAHLDFLFQNN